MSLLAAFLRLPRKQQAQALEAAAYLGLAGLLVHHVPMRWWRGQINAAVVGGTAPTRARGNERAVGRIVRKVARRLPCGTACLPRAMAAQWMLRRRRVASRLLFGVRRVAGSGENAYHAWLTVNGQPVIGGRTAAAFTPLPAVSAIPVRLARRERRS